MLRIALFLATNIAVLAVASITLNLLGFDGYMAANGVDLNLTALLIFCGIFGMSGSIISLLLSKFMAKKAMRVQLIENPRSQEEIWVLDTVTQLAREAGIGMPEVGIFPSDASNAFATGWNKNNALVAVSSGLLSRFRPEETRAVLAHEIGHVANGDMVTLALIQGVVNTFVMFFARVIGHTIDRAVFKNERGHGIAYYITVFVTEMILAVLASMIVFWFSRRREFRADAWGAQLAGPGAMIGALARLKAESGAPPQMPETMQAFGISGGLRSKMGKLFTTHPPLDDRIAALQQTGISR